ncbi:MAG: hypothetical protein MZV64_11865 [Ignavibacteriales bacterium]|nr:hypothetical protein [Ignavibacteriales bacterium]
MAESDPEHRLGRDGRGQHLPGLRWPGIGVFKSTDAGKTWTHMGLEATYTIARVVIHPTEPRHRLRRGHRPRVDRPTPTAASTRRPTAGRPGRRSSTSTSRSAPTTWSWTRASPTPSTPRPGTASAGAGATPSPAARTASTRRPTAARPGRPSTAGSPTRTSPAASASTSAGRKPSTLYAYVDNHAPGAEPKPRREGRLRPAGASRASSAPRSTAPTTPARAGARSARRAWSASAAPTAGSSARSASTPTRRRPSTSWAWACPSRPTAARPIRTSTSAGLHGDHHGLWIDPNDSNHLINNNDGGVNISYDGGKTWRDFHDGIPSVQFYNVALDISTPFCAYGSVQDQGTYRGLIPLQKPTAGAPAGRQALRPDPAEVGARAGRRGDAHRHRSDGSQHGVLVVLLRPARALRVQGRRSGRARRSIPKAAEGEPAYRGQWLAATTLSPHNPQIVYHGFQYLFRSMNKGETWERISPDLTYNNPDRAGPMALRHPLRHDHRRRRVAVQVRPHLRRHGRRPGLGDQDERRQPGPRSRPASPTTSTSGRSSPRSTTRPRSTSRSSAATTTTSIPTSSSPTDYGKTWVSIAGNIPGGPVNVVREDPKVKDILYAGTDTGVYVSRDGGADLERPRRQPADELRLGPRHPPAGQRPGHRHQRPGHVDHRRPGAGAERGEITGAQDVGLSRLDHARERCPRPGCP